MLYRSVDPAKNGVIIPFCTKEHDNHEPVPSDNVNPSNSPRDPEISKILGPFPSRVLITRIELFVL